MNGTVTWEAQIATVGFTFACMLADRRLLECRGSVRERFDKPILPLLGFVVLAAAVIPGPFEFLAELIRVHDANVLLLATLLILTYGLVILLCVALSREAPKLARLWTGGEEEETR